MHFKTKSLTMLPKFNLLHLLDKAYFYMMASSLKFNFRCTMLYLLYCAVSVLCHICLYYAVFFCTVLYLAVLCHICLYYAVSGCTMPYVLVLCHIFLYNAVCACILLYLFVLCQICLYCAISVQTVPYLCFVSPTIRPFLIQFFH